MSDLRDLFHKPSEHPIGGVPFTLHKLQFDQFGDALVLAQYLEKLDVDAFNVEELQKLAGDSHEREALKRTLAGCLSVRPPTAPPGQPPQQLLPADIDVMPAVMLAEALAVVMEVNADFFFQSLPRLLQVGLRIRSTGSELLNRLSAPGTAPTA